MGTALGAAGLWAVAGAPASAQVSGGSVAAGSAQISGAGTSNILVTQSSRKAVVDWRSFSVAAGDSVRFAQPDRGSVTLNRVTGAAGSRIDGSLTANGQVWLLNPNGVIVGQGGQIAAGGFLATTHALSNDDFMAGRYGFADAAVSGAAVINAGRIEAGEGGYAVLAGRAVANHGLIEARLGTVALGAAKQFTLDLAGDRLLSFAVAGVLDALPASGAAAVTNRGALRADGGRVVMTARAAAEVVEQVINTSGLVQAESVRLVDGQVVLDGGEAGLVLAAGRLDVSGAGEGESGGRLHVLGDTIIVGDGAALDARGDAGGGEILVGGGWQGESIDGRASAIRVAVAPSATLDASAITGGDGGTVVAWSDVGDAASRTYALGSFRADGGAQHGDGGRIETSGHDLITTGVRGSAAAPNGKAGTWLFDPYDIEIVAGGPANPGFEEGLLGWSRTGQHGVVQAVTQATSSNGVVYGSVVSPGGKFLLARAGDPNSNVGVEQTFYAAAGQTLTVYGLFLAKDYLPYNDRAAIELISPTGSTQILYARNVAGVGDYGTAPWQPNGVIPVTLEQTGSYTLRAYAQNAADAAAASELGFEVNAPSTSFGGSFVGSGFDRLWAATSPSSKVNANDISALLTSDTNVHISTTVPGTQAGNITVNADIVKSAALGGPYDATLKLEADGSIILNNRITSLEGRLDVELLAKGGSITVKAPIEVMPAVGLAGNITLTASVTGGLIDIQEGAPLRGDHVSLNADRMTVGASVSAKSSITVAPTTVNRTIRLEPNSSSGDVLSLSHATLANLQAPKLTVGHASGTGRIEIDPGLQSLPGSELAREVVIRSPGTGGRIEIRSNQLDIAANERWRFIAGDEILLGTSARLDIAGTLELVAGQRFTNQSGADALSTEGGRWLIYSADPTLDVFDGLSSGAQALWGRSFADASAGNIVATGNHYAFGLTPVLTVTAKNRSKTYGDVSSFGASDYTIGGLISASQFNNVFLQDQFTGTASLTSGGAAERANAGSYSIDVSAGTLAAPQGYATQFKSGALTINQKAISASLTGTVQKVYDGTVAATLASENYALSGVLSGDGVSVSTTAGGYADKNAGTGKTVTVQSLQLTGASAGNYAISGPVSGAVGRIDAKAINGTAVVANKVYDGTTAATGTLTLAGTIAGDNVATMGATFAFVDRNAGTAKAVNTVGAALTGSDAGNYTLTVGPATANIAQKAIGGTATAASKTYDGTTAATGSVSLTGVILNDGVALTGGNFAFADRNAGTAKTVNLSGFGLTGTDAGNYALSLPAATTADIFQKMLTGTVVADSRTYDGTTSVSGGIALAGVIGGDAVGASASLVFADKNAGSGKTVTASGLALTGQDAGNYSLAAPTAAVADIFRKPIEATVAAASKTYDGSTATTGTITLQGIIGGDAVTAGGSFAFTDKNAGIAKTVMVSGATLAGGDAQNYALAVPATTVADIAQKAISASVAANNKVYDGTTGATGTVMLSGTVVGDAVATSAGTFAFADAAAGLGKTVNVSGIVLTGADAGNYLLSIPATTIAAILQKAITASVVADSKVYDGNVGTTGSAVLNGLVAGDVVGTTGASFAFADRNAGIGKTVTITGLTLTGIDAGNYVLSVPAPVMADILQKAITATVAANGKVYDGTTAATGTVGVAGIGDDQIFASGATFAFADKNAGAGKTVNITGVQLSGAHAGNYTLTVPASALATVTQKSITATVSAQDKIYDGATAATGSVVLNGTVTGDSVSPTGASFAFTDRNAGTGKTVNVSGVTLAGGDAGNYSLTVPATAVASILQKLVSAAVAVEDKVYDGTTAAIGSVAIDGLLATDNVGVTAANFAFVDKNVGAAKLVNVSDVGLTGVDAANYNLSVAPTATASITPKAIGGLLAATSKTYDGNTATTGTVTLQDVVRGDDVSAAGAVFAFADRNAGFAKLVNVTGVGLTGVDAANYTLDVPSVTFADVFRRSITALLTANDKIYDGLTTTTGTLALLDTVEGDDIDTSGSQFAFADRNAGLGKAVLVTGTALTGEHAANYALTPVGSTVGDITPKTIVGTASAQSKVYDGNTATLGSVGLQGVVTGDTVSAAGAIFAFTDRNAGVAKTVNVAGATLSGADAGNYLLDLPSTTFADITPKAITALVAADDKIYDGTTAANGAATLVGTVSGDMVSASNGIFSFADRNAGIGKIVNVADISLVGADAGNYALTVPATAIADILQKALDAAAFADSKIYDGTTAATGGIVLNGVVEGDAVATAASFAFSDKNAGTAKTVNVADVGLTGADAGNYSLIAPTTAFADIAQKAITATVAAQDKVYDGTTATTGTSTLVGTVAGDAVSAGGGVLTFADRNAGLDKLVNVTSVGLTGADAGNYALSVPSTTTADIFQKVLGATAFASNKIYDGTTATTGRIDLTGTIAGDAVAVNGATFSFVNKNAGTAKTVNIANAGLAGADAGNYSLVAPTTALADILKKSITATVSAQSKTYDGTTAAIGTVGLNGTIAGDVVAPTGAHFAFADRNAGTAKTVNISGVTLAGADAGNYALSTPATTAADILKKVLAANATAASKTYDGNTAATGQLALAGIVAGDAVTTSGTQFAFADRNAGTGKLVNISGAKLAGSDAGNYSLDAPATTIADILRKLVDVKATAAGKIYDGTTATTGTVGLIGLVSGDDVNTAGALFAFADANAGTGKTVGLTGLTLVARDAGNYVLGALPTITADITPKSLTAALAGSAQKIYDATTAATLSAANYNLAGFVSGEGASVGQTSGSFASPNVGSNLVVTASLSPTSFAANGGTSLGNYLLPTSASGAIGSITPATLTYVANPAERPRGNPDPALTGNVTGFVGPDTQATATAGALAFATTASINSPVGAYAINGAGLTAGNYVFTQAPANATAFRVTEAMSAASSVSVVVQSATVTTAPTPTPAPTPAPTPTPAPAASTTSTGTTPSAPAGNSTGPAAGPSLVVASPPPPPPPPPPPAPPLSTGGNATGGNAAPPPPPPGPPVEATPPSPVGEAAPPTPNDSADQGDTVLTEAAAPEEEQEEATSEKRQVASTTIVVPGVNIEVPRPPRPPEVPGADQAFSGSGNPAQW